MSKRIYLDYLEEKTPLCEKFIQEADKVSNLMSVIKMYCQQVIDEETCGGYRGDGANDPDNVPKRKSTTPPEEFFDIVKSVRYNDFIQMPELDDMIYDMMGGCDEIIVSSVEDDCEVGDEDVEAFYHFVGLMKYITRG